MAKSLIEELPRIASEGRRDAQNIIEQLSSGTTITDICNQCKISYSVATGNLFE